MEKLNLFEFPDGDLIDIDYFNKSSRTSNEPQTKNISNEDFVKNLIGFNTTSSILANKTEEVSNDLVKNPQLPADQLQTLSSLVLLTSLLNQPQSILANNINPTNQNNQSNSNYINVRYLHF